MIPSTKNMLKWHLDLVLHTRKEIHLSNQFYYLRSPQNLWQSKNTFKESLQSCVKSKIMWTTAYSFTFLNLCCLSGNRDQTRDQKIGFISFGPALLLPAMWPCTYHLNSSQGLLQIIQQYFNQQSLFNLMPLSYCALFFSCSYKIWLGKEKKNHW